MLAPLVLTDVVQAAYLDGDHVQRLSQQFKQTGYVTLHSFLSERTFSLIDQEALKLRELGIRRNFVMPHYQTPRRLSVAGGRTVLEHAVAIPSLYVHHQLNAVLSQLTQSPLHTIKHPEECIVANYLDGPGQTHGWHLDDPTYALIVILHAPDEGCGGCVEYVPQWKQLCSELGIDPYTAIDQGLDVAKQQDLIKRVHLNAGDCYLLNASENLHRVTPIVDDASYRRIINMAFDHRPSFTFGDTADILYGGQALA